MSKVSHKSLTGVALTVSADQEIGRIDCTNCNGISFQLNGIALTAGSIKLQWSNDNNNWEDIPSATATLAASVAKIINVPNLYTGHVRALATLSAGPGNYEAFFLAKEH